MSKAENAHRRLMDMVAGWSEWVQEDFEENDDEHLSEEEVDGICDLYQKAANVYDEEASDKVNLDAIEKFIKIDLRDFVLTGS